MKKDILEPAVIFTFSFTLLSVMAMIFAGKWELDLHINTFLTIGGGVLIFDIVANLTKKWYGRHEARRLLRKKKTSSHRILSSMKKAESKIEVESTGVPEEIVIPKRKKQICLLLLLISGVIYLMAIVKASGISIASISDIPRAISAYNTLVKFSVSDFNVDLPFFVTNLQVMVVGFSYYVMYVMVHNYVYTRKIYYWDLWILMTCFVVSMLGGSRGYIFFTLLAGLVYYLYLEAKRQGKRNILNKKNLKKIGLIAGVALVLFIPAARLLGRNVEESPIEYMSIYCGAQMENLNSVLRKDEIKRNNELPGGQTFMSLYRTFGRRLGIDEYVYRKDMVFHFVNGQNLGNVYTTFYAYIYDFGYGGMLIMVALMAVISQIIYEKVLRARVGDCPRVVVLIYGIVASSLVLSFFSEKFYAGMNMATLRYVLVFIICNHVLVNRCYTKKEATQYDIKKVEIFA